MSELKRQVINMIPIKRLARAYDPFYMSNRLKKKVMKWIEEDKIRVTNL